MIETKNKFYAAILIIVLLALTIRLVGLGSFMTVDEERWMIRSGTFYHKLFDRADPGGTYTTTHPGVTTQWLSGLGIYLQEKNIGQNIDTSNLNRFRLAATVPIVLAVTLLILIVIILTTKLTGRLVGIWTGLLLATEPYLVGMSQISHVDMLLSLFMLCAALSILLYFQSGKKNWLYMTGLFMGLSFATKLMPSLWLIIFVGAVLITRGIINSKSTQKALIRWAIVTGIGVFVFYLIWPALWVKTDLNNSYQKDVKSVITQEHIEQAETDSPINPLTFYGRTILSRTTPFVLFLAVGLIILALKYAASNAVFHHFVGKLERHDDKKNEQMHISAINIGWLSLYILGFLVLITLAAKKGDRYALPAITALPVLAGAATVIAWPVIIKNITLLQTKKARQALLVFIVVSLLLQPLTWAPYTIAYTNNLFNLRPYTQQGWGEGLDAAARWLNQSPVLDRLVVASWYPDVTRTYFKGKTMSLSSRHDHRVGYVITYRNMKGRAPDDIATNALDEFKNKKPEHVVTIGGREYAWIYNVMGLYYYPKNTGELTAGREVGQTIDPPDDWQQISIGFSNYSGRDNTEEVILHIKNSPEDTTDLRTLRINASQIKDRQWHKFNFETIKTTPDRQYYLSLTSPQSKPGNAVTINFSDRDILPGKMYWRKKPLKENETMQNHIRPDFDIAYRLPEDE